MLEPDGRTMYFVDTPTREIMAYAYDPATGTPSAPRLFRRVEDTPGWPDGSIVDRERRFTIPERKRAIVREFRKVIDEGFAGHDGIRRATCRGQDHRLRG